MLNFYLFFQLGTTLIIFATNIYYLYASRVLFGLVGGASGLIIALLVNDISFDRWDRISADKTAVFYNSRFELSFFCLYWRVRGALNSLYDPSFNLGIISTFIVGRLLPCMTQAKIQLIPTAIFAIALFFLPESPEHLRNRNKRKVNGWTYSISESRRDSKVHFNFSKLTSRVNSTKEVFSVSLEAFMAALI